MRSSIFSFAAGSGIAAVLVLGSCSVWSSATQKVQASAFSVQAAQTPPVSPPAQTSQTPPAAKPAVISTAAARGDAWKVLDDGLADKDFDHRANAISALGTIGLQPEVVRLVEGGLEDKSTSVREAAARALGRMKSRGSIPKLREALDDQSAIVVYAAATALCQMDDKSGEEVLAEILSGDRKASAGRVDQGMRTAHEKIHDPKELLALGAEMTAEGLFPPAIFGVKFVEDMSKDKSAAPRAASALLLGDSTDADARDTLEHALEDGSWLVRAAAAQAIARHGTQREIAMLAPLLNDDHFEVRYEAAAAIVRLAPRM
jgi:HEAT repeat protein